MGTGTKGNILYTIDFGLAKEFCNTERFQTKVCKAGRLVALGDTRVLTITMDEVRSA